MNRDRHVIVPKDSKAMNDYDFDMHTPEQIYLWKMTDNEFKNLWKMGIFHKINNACNVLIDDYEEEVIPFEKLQQAKEIIEHALQKNYIKELNKLYEMICDAIKRKTLIAFDF